MLVEVLFHPYDNYDLELNVQQFNLVPSCSYQWETHIKFGRNLYIHQNISHL